MPEPDPAKIMTFAMPKDLGLWLKVNHATESELWMKIFKKKSGIPSVTWNDVESVAEFKLWSSKLVSSIRADGVSGHVATG